MQPEPPAGTQSWLGRVVDALTKPLVSRLAPHPALAYVLMAVLLAGAFAALILLNVLVRTLEGELAYGVVVTAIGLWALTQTNVVRGLRESWGEPGFSLRRAFVWAAFGVVALPVAAVHPERLEALAVLLVIPVAWLVDRLGRHLAGGAPSTREPWIPVAAGMLFLLIFIWRYEPAEEAETPAGAPPAQAAELAGDAELALQVRPTLLFDLGESRVPLDIDDAIRAGRVATCEDGVCGKPIEDATELDLGADYLTVADVTGVRGGGAGSAYYYHVVERDNRIYVDFWWYFARNPSPIGASVGCGPAARWVGLTCHDHPSDWEGVTVVLSPCTDDSEVCLRHGDREWAPAAVRYAEHDHLVSYAWSTLRRLWGQRVRTRGRPLVFIARDSHASYAEPCPSGCKQFGRYPWRTRRDEAPHDGGQEWRWNGEGCEPGAAARAARDCLLPMPITVDGLAASWNAYPGRWGTQRCIFDGAYCDTSAAPRSPSRQGRYRDPGRPGPWRCVARDRPGRRPVLDVVDEADPDDDLPARCPE